METPRVVQELTPDNYQTLDEAPLDHEELEARDHWERFLPTMAAELKAKGTLDLEVRKASHRRDYLLAAHAAKTGLHPDQLAELYREELFPLPEQEPTRDRDR
jgi:hypothetical protein